MAVQPLGNIFAPGRRVSQAGLGRLAGKARNVSHGLHSMARFAMPRISVLTCAGAAGGRPAQRRLGY